MIYRGSTPLPTEGPGGGPNSKYAGMIDRGWIRIVIFKKKEERMRGLPGGECGGSGGAQLRSTKTHRDPPRTTEIHQDTPRTTENH